MERIESDDTFTWGDWAIIAALIGFLVLGGWALGTMLDWLVR